MIIRLVVCSLVDKYLICMFYMDSFQSIVIHQCSKIVRQFNHCKASYGVKPDRGCSDINDYSLARAVMASVTFPAVFNLMTLFDYTKDKGDSRYMHVFYGGNVDNLGLKSVLRIIDTLHVNKISYDKLVNFVDTNVIDATDSLLARNRKNQLEEFKRKFNTNIDASQSVIYHLQFSNIEDIVLRKNCMGLRPVLISNPKGKKLLIVQSSTC